MRTLSASLRRVGASYRKSGCGLAPGSDTDSSHLESRSRLLPSPPAVKVLHPFLRMRKTFPSLAGVTGQTRAGARAQSNHSAWTN